MKGIHLLLFILIHCCAYTQNIDNALLGSWNGAGLTGQKNDVIMGEIDVEKDNLPHTGGDYLISINLQTPADRNKMCSFYFRMNSLRNINVNSKDILSMYPDQPVCSYWLDKNGNYVPSEADICFSSVQLQLINVQGKQFIKLLLQSDHELCAGKLYLSKRNDTQDEENVFHLFNDPDALKSFHDSVNRAENKTSADEGTYDQLFIRNKTLNKSATFQYFPDDEILLIDKPYLSPFSLHVTKEEYAVMDKSGNFKITNSFFNAAHMWLMNGQITGLVPGKTFYYPNVWAFNNGLDILKKLAPALIEKEAPVNAKIVSSSRENVKKENSTTSEPYSVPSNAVLDQEINELANCQTLINTGKTQAEKDELQKDYWTLLGIVSDLSNYRQLFLQKGNLINLFPTAYYHTTYSEMKRIVSANEYKYPIEKMKQMIAFYDAYKFNRNLWDNGMKNNVEPHWREHFEYAESIAADLDVLCSNIGFVLSTGIAAHVQCDLPRAIDYAYINRYNKSIVPTNADYILDYSKTSDLFKLTKNETIEDISNAKHCWQSYLNWVLNWKDGALPDVVNGAYEEYTSFCEKYGFKKVLTDNDVIYLRQEAWRKAFSGKPFTNINGYSMLGQPTTNHTILEEAGQKICPGTNINENKFFKVNPQDITHPNDKAFKWYDWDKAPEDMKIAAGYVNMYTNRSTGKLENLLDEINKSMRIGCSVKIAALDLDDDGVFGLVMYAAGNTCCGTQGCTYHLYDNGGLKSIDLGLVHGENDAVPARGGVTASTGVSFSLKPNALIPSADRKSITALFTYDTAKKFTPAANLKSLVGGVTPDELGKILLKAIKTNDKTLWINCIHPEVEKDYPNRPDIRQWIADGFDRLRRGLIQQGISNWSLVQFSSVTFQTFDEGQHATRFTVEFTYNNKEFIGGFILPSTGMYKGKYFMLTGIEDFGIRRAPSH